jgi:uncharacterized membrane protein
MTEETETTTEESEEMDMQSILNKFQINGAMMFIWTIIYSLIGAGIVILLSSPVVPKPFLMVDLFKLGLLPIVAIIAVTGAIRGPIAGFLTGYLGVVISDLLFYGAVVTMTLPALAYGVLGFVVGLASYDFTNGRSLGKLSVLSMIGWVFTILLVVVIALLVEVYATMAAIGFVMLPLMTLGLPTAILLTPILARLWHLFMSKIMPSALVPR